MAAKYFFDSKDGHGLRHDPFLAIVGPRPIGWISTRSLDGVNNLAPFSLFNAIGHNPSLLAFSCAGPKDSFCNVRDTGEFVWNLATEPLAHAMNVSSTRLPPEIDEFAFSGLTPVAGARVSAPRVLESPVSFECRLTEIIALKDLEGGTTNMRLIVGQVVAGHIDHDLIVDGVYDTARAQPILRAGARDIYVSVPQSAFFTIRRPDES